MRLAAAVPSRALAVALAVATAGTARAADDESGIISSDNERVHYALGARVRGLFVPGFLMGTFAQQYQTSSSYAVGGEFTRRKGALDVVVSLDFSNYDIPDGNWLGSGKDPKLDTHYVQLRGLHHLSADVSFIWAPDLTRWLSLMIGGGIGLGVVMGDIFVVNNSSAICNVSNPGDPALCHPVANAKLYQMFGDPVPTWTDAAGMNHTFDPSGSGEHIKPGDPDFQRKLDGLARSQAQCQGAGSAGSDCRDTAEHPYYHASTDKPPVMVVVNVLIGFRLKLHRHLNVNVSGGFRDGFFIGGGPEVVF